jgi:putative tricarboxylic transport membrane protein
LFALVSGTLVGFWTGVMPGTGATVAQFLGYGIARQYSKDKANFGKGAIEGVIAPQAAANAAGIGATLPMLTMGIPGSPTTAVLLAGIWIWGLTPGPRLFTEHSDFVWGFIASMYLANLVALLICLLGVPVLASIMRIPYGILTPFIVVISIIGAYVINNSFLDIWVALGAGVLGYLMRKLGYPLAAFVIAMVLGDMTETALRQSLILGDGSPAIFFTRPLSGALMGVAIILFFYPLLQGTWQRVKTAVTATQRKKD